MPTTARWLSWKATGGLRHCVCYASLIWPAGLRRRKGLVSRFLRSNESLSATLQQVSVHPVANRERARPFIGFKHINGPAKWDAYAKARFAAQWYGSGKSEGIDLTDIARAIGDVHDTIKRMVFAIYVLDQAKDEDLFDIEDRYVRRFNFSHLYAALSRSQYLDYLDLRAAWVRHDPEPNQVPPHKREELRKVLAWIYGSKKDGLRPVIQSQNPRYQTSRGSARSCSGAARAGDDAEPRCGAREHRARGLAIHRFTHSCEGKHMGHRRLAQGL